MMTFKNLTLIGTSHIAKESVTEVEHVIGTVNPDIIALELDLKRFQALMNPGRKLSLRDIKYLGVRGWLINLIGSWAELKMGKLVGMKPGTEMKTAVMLAAKSQARIALIDQDITITIKRLIKKITFKEKMRFIGDIIMALLGKKPEMQFDLKKVPDQNVIKKLMEEVKARYPSVYMVLVHERDVYMAKALNKLVTTEPNKKIVAIVGAGHEESIIKHMIQVRQSDSLQNKK